MHVLRVAAFSLALSEVAFAQPFSVGSARAERGQKANGFIEVPAAADAATSIPVTVVHGAKPGPVLSIVSGSHGTEYASIIISREMVLAFGLDHIIISADRPKDPAASRYLENTASTRGKPSITAEAGHAGTVEPEDVRALVRGCLGVMRYLKMLPGTPKLVESPVWIASVRSVTSEQAGVFYPLVKRGSYVAKGTRLGYVTDYFGQTLFEAQAPEAGVVLYVCAVPSMKKGDTIANIGVVQSDGR